MIVNNGLYPHHLKAGAEAEPLEDGPFIAISLLKFKQMAEYRDEPTSTLTGAEAYSRYVDALGNCLDAVGARLVYVGDVAGVDVGEVEDLWDMAAMVEYPSFAAAQAILKLPDYQPIVRHRRAGLAGQLSLRVKLKSKLV
jgi:uncharacterized protein (DUF1330 family)